jgi:hypothetical protein
MFERKRGPISSSEFLISSIIDNTTTYHNNNNIGLYDDHIDDRLIDYFQEEEQEQEQEQEQELELEQQEQELELEDEQEQQEQELEHEFFKDNEFCSDLDINDQMKEFMNKANANANAYSQNNINNNDDDDICFEINSKSTCTKSEFARKFNNISNSHGLSKIAMLDILNLFDHCTSNLNLPLKKKRTKNYLKTSKINPFILGGGGGDGEEEEEKNDDFDDEDLKQQKENEAQKNLDIDRYLIEDHSKFVFDVCPKSCIVYFGKNSQKIICPVCETWRFSKCKHKSCRNKSYLQCNPFDEEEGHSVKYRFPLKSIFYRSSIVVLTEKLLNAKNKKLDYLNYLENRIQSSIIDDKLVSPPEYIVDSVDSQAVKKNYEDMVKNFDSLKKQYESNMMKAYNNKRMIVMKNFILSGFYDGATFFKRNSDSGWFYLIGILNCSPSVRMSLGKGLYLSLLHLEKPGGKIDRFFMQNILAEELRQLETGVFI